MASKAQVSLEYMSIIGLALLALVVVWFFVTQTTSNTSDQASVSVLRRTAELMRDAANLVYTQGPPAKATVQAVIPPGVSAASVSGKEIYFEITTRTGVNSVSAFAYAPLVSHGLDALISAPGKHPLTVAAVYDANGEIIVQINASGG